MPNYTAVNSRPPFLQSPQPGPTGSAATVLAESLDAVYGSQAPAQYERYTNALSHFRAFAGPGPAWLFRAPGRVNLIGEHTDYNHGFVMPIALDRDILLIARPRPDHTIRIANAEPQFEQVSFETSSEIPHAPPGDWSNYVRGAAQMVAQAAPDAYSGMDCLIVGEAPLGLARGSGLSSSSALTVAAGVALAHFARFAPPPEQFVQACSDAEWYVGTRGGIMDQFISLLARRDHALFLDCRPSRDGRYVTQHIPLPEDHQILIADSGVQHSNVRGEYNKRVASCRIGVALLSAHWAGITHLRDLHGVPWQDVAPHLPEQITVSAALAAGMPIAGIPGLAQDDRLNVRACCRHVWHENHRVLAVLESLRNGDVNSVGWQLQQAHASARDDYAVSTPELETLVAAASDAPGVVGARLTGAGWGGCVLVLVHQDSATEAAEVVQYRFHQKYGRTPSIFPCRTGAAAGLVTSLEI